MGLALLCVFTITFILLAEIKICLIVFLCVALTLVDVVGTLNFWGTTLDPLSSVNIILAVGLCIDYPAHIAHSFLVATGNISHNFSILSQHMFKTTYNCYLVIYPEPTLFSGSSVQRAQTSLLKICPAVLNGGMTTFLALIVLADSNSHAFLTFFKVFFLTVVFGMFHGVVFLPAILSWIGGENIKQDSSSQGSSDIQMTASKQSGLSCEEPSELNISQSKDKNCKLSSLDMIIIYITGIKYNSDT